MAKEVVRDSGVPSPANPEPESPRISRRRRDDRVINRMAAPKPSSEEELADRKLLGYAMAMGRLSDENVPGSEEQKGRVLQGLEEVGRILAGPAGLREKRQTVLALEEAIAPLLPGRTPTSERQPRVQRHASGQADQATTSPSRVLHGIRSLRGNGRPLPTALREYFETHLGENLTRIRIHTDSVAASLAASLDASAFTVGGDIAFASGRYAPESEGGLELLGHELTHTIQQGFTSPLSDVPYDGRVTPVRRHGGLRVSRAMDTACTGTSRHPGNLAHLFIESWYTTVTNPIFGEAEFSIPFGNASGTDIGFADLVDTAVPAIYEIKPWLGRASGVEQAQRYRDAAQAFCDPERLWMLGALYPFTVFPVSATHELASAQTEHLGVVGYWYRMRPPPVPVPEPKPAPRRIEVPEPKPVPWWVPVGAALGYVVWNSKGCLAGPWGCAIDWATPGI